MATIPTIHTGSMSAEYSVTQSAATGKWVAVGTVRSLLPTAKRPAWILVGLGGTALDAVDDLRRQLERQVESAEA